MCAAAAASVAASVPAFSAAVGIAVECVAAVAAAEFGVAVVGTDAYAFAASDAGDAADAAAVATATLAVVFLVSLRNSYLKMHCCLGKLDGSQVPGVAWHFQKPIGRVAEWGPPCRDACLDVDIGDLQACGSVVGPETEHGALLPLSDDPTPARELVRFLGKTAKMPGKAFLTLKPPSHDLPCEKI